MINIKDNPNYRRWESMKQRCFNENHTVYEHYGGRGITVCKEWKNDFNSYDDYISNLDNANKEGMTIDREDNEKNYEPGNLRWVNQTVQLCNQRIQSNNKSGYRGVYYDKVLKQYRAQVSINNKIKEVGHSKSILEAVSLRDDYITKNKLPHKISTEK